jgi:glycosyltransferase involved in cell wall biosynthesis
MTYNPPITHVADFAPRTGSIWLMVDAANYGGIERHVQTLAVGLSSRGYPAEFVLYQKRGQTALLNQLEASRATVRILDGTFIGLLQALKRDRPALLHTHGYKANILGRLAARLAGVAHIATFHSAEKAKFPVSGYYALDNLSSFLGGRIAVSEEIGERLPFAAEIIPSHIVARPSASTAPLPRRVGLVGRLVPSKAPHVFCEIARRGPPDIEWHIYGDGELRNELETKYGRFVTFHGAVGDMTDVWNSLGLLLMPSIAEGLPLAALEALSAGVPVAATRVGGLPTAVVPGISGWLFERDDMLGGLRTVELWAALDAEAQLELRRSCWQHVRDNFSEEAMLPRILQAYQQTGYAAPFTYRPSARR